MKRFLLAGISILLTAAVVVVSMMGATPRTVHMAALDAIKKGDFEMALSHLKRSDHPDAEVLRSYMHYVPKSITRDENGAVSTENYVYTQAGLLYKEESGAADGTLKTRINAYNALGNPVECHITIQKPDQEPDPDTPPIPEEEMIVEEVSTDYREEYFYDSLGHLLCKRTTDGTGRLYQYRYTYDVLGRVITEIYVDGDAKWSRREFTYDGDTDCLTEKYTDYAGMWENVTNTYVDEMLRTEVVKNADGVTTTGYDVEGRILSQEEVRKDGTVNKILFTYDGKGNLLERAYSDGRKDVYRYSDSGRLISSERVAEDGTVTVTVCTYDEKDRMLSRSVKVDDTGEEVTTYTYDKKGKLTKEEFKGLKGEWKTTEYVYERYGNPETVTVTTESGVTVTTIEWKVRYYPEGMPENVRALLEQYDVDMP